MSICQISPMELLRPQIYDHMSFGSPKRTCGPNPMRYHGASIKNSYCHQPPSIVTQSIRIYDHFKVSPIG